MNALFDWTENTHPFRENDAMQLILDARSSAVGGGTDCLLHPEFRSLVWWVY